MNYHLVVLGCQMNQSDSERVKRVIEEMGLVETLNEDDADLIGIIACSVRQKAIDKVYTKIQKWNSLKNKKPLITFATGCILPDDKLKFLKQFDLVFDIGEVLSLPKLIAQYGVSSPLVNALGMAKELSFPSKSDISLDAIMVDSDVMIRSDIKPTASFLSPLKRKTISFENQQWEVKPKYNSGFEAYVPIQNGCDKFCTFCAVPYTRGREVSRPSTEILDEINHLVASGYKSITLLGQNVNSYGKDSQGSELSFADLLSAVGEIIEKARADVWVYFTSPHPRDMTREVIEVISRYSCLAKQIHLPLQSGDNKVLIRMNRKHNMDRYREIVGWIRELLPTATLFTDIIVGFTGESDEQFERTRLAMNEFKYNMAYIATYSPRPGAASFQWADDVDHAVKKERLAVLTTDLVVSASEYTSQMMHQTIKILVRNDDRKQGYLTGHTEGKIVVRFACDDKALIGQFVQIKVTSTTPFSVEGNLV